MKTNQLQSAIASAFTIPGVIKSISRSKRFQAAALCALFCAFDGPGVAFAADAPAEAKSPVSVTIDVPVLSAYVWRGQVINNEFVTQPSLTVTKGGFSVNVVNNVNFTHALTAKAPELTETDLTLAYTTKIRSLATTFGWIEYQFSNQTVLDAGGNVKALPGTRELFLNAGLPDLPGTPAVALYHDFDEIKGTYFVASSGYSHAFEKEGVTAAISGAVGYGTAGYNKGYFGVNSAAFNDLTLTASAAIKAADNLTLTPAVQYVSLLNRDIRNAAKSVFKDNHQAVYSLKLSYTL